MQEKQRAFLVRTAYWAVWAVLLWLGVRYLLRWLLPFLLALALAAAVEPVIAWCRRRMGLKRGFTAAVVTIAVTGAILALAAVIVWQLIRQAAELLGQLPGLLAGLPGMTEDLRQRLEDFCAACPQGLRSWLEEVPALLGTLAAGVAQRASGACITAAAALAAALPGVFLFCGTTALAVFFTAGSYPRVMAFFRRQLGHRLDRARGVKANLLSTLGKWCRAQAILLGVTFCELLAGFLLMGQRYALLLAAVTALVDALPVFGTGTVLLPWAAVCLLAGQAPRAVALAALYVVISAVRSLLEPKVMAAQAGLPPLAALAAMYAGFRALGVAGMILLPMALSLNVPIPMIVGAVAGGAVFGGHTSPISDTTIMSCSSTGCDVVSHVKTQLPYSLCFAAAACVLYLVVGAII